MRRKPKRKVTKKPIKSYNYTDNPLHIDHFSLRRLLAAFILFGALLMFFASISQFYSAVDISAKCKNNELDTATCTDLAYKISGTGVVIGDADLTYRQLMLEFIAIPVAKFFFWGAVLIFAWFLYRADRIRLPLI